MPTRKNTPGLPKAPARPAPIRPSAAGRQAPKHEVSAVPERAGFEMRFPVVEGFVVDLQRHLVRCNVDDMERIKLNPWDTPTAAFVRPQVGYAIGSPGTQTGFGFDLVTREEYYRNTHLQTIAFEVAREVVRQLVEAAHPKAERLRSSRARDAVSASLAFRSGLHRSAGGLQWLQPL